MNSKHPVHNEIAYDEDFIELATPHETRLRYILHSRSTASSTQIADYASRSAGTVSQPEALTRMDAPQSSPDIPSTVSAGMSTHSSIAKDRRSKVGNLPRHQHPVSLSAYHTKGRLDPFKNSQKHMVREARTNASETLKVSITPKKHRLASVQTGDGPAKKPKYSTREDFEHADETSMRPPTKLAKQVQQEMQPPTSIRSLASDTSIGTSTSNTSRGNAMEDVHETFGDTFTGSSTDAMDINDSGGDFQNSENGDVSSASGEELGKETESRDQTDPGDDGEELATSSALNMSDRDLIQHQYEYISELRASVKYLEQELHELNKSRLPEEIKPRTQLLHRVICDCGDVSNKESIYQDHPEYLGAAEVTSHIHGRLRIADVENYLDRNREVYLLVYNDYVCRESSDERRRLARIARQKNESPSEDQMALKCSESFSIISAEMCSVLQQIVKVMPNGWCYPKVEVREFVRGPYIFFYHDKAAILERAASLRGTIKADFGLLVSYLQESSAAEFSIADELLSKGLVSSRTIQYLFAPGQILVHKKDSEYLTYCASSYLHHDEWKVNAWRWQFDGAFWKEDLSVPVIFPRSQEDTMRIEDLPIYPLQFSSGPDLEERLRDRGKQFWSCRIRKYVCYRDKDRVDINNVSEISRMRKKYGRLAHYSQTDVRYMVDYKTWNNSKKGNAATAQPQEPGRRYLDQAIMRQQSPPEPMLLLLPHVLVGFNMLNKRWEPLKVSCILDVIWNKDAFKSLVLEEETKHCVQALVTNQVSVEKSTDLVYGKGNGLVILLHGGPGTGKTLTAESVAELAEKPLYRVTCGDIGTDPRAVERHLQSALNLGKVWGCVILLDEADIFLEERSLHDLSRNALVSVFLRALEYYDGILILTTNRVGTFDEAFKSRIQLSLHYQRLTDAQRCHIWENFLERLENIDEERVNIEDLRRNVKEFARYEMNGRQIRNALTTARQLALYDSEVMDCKHLNRAIRISTRFDKYLRSVKHGVSDDDIARDDGVR
jgi:hypothetical protein